LKDLVKKQEDSKMVVVVMAKQQAAPAEKHHQGNMDPHLLALAWSGSYEKLQSLLNDEAAGQTSGHSGSPDGGLTAWRASSYGGDDTEANQSILAGVTAAGDTALHVVAASGQGDNFFTSCREAKHLLPQENDKWQRWRGCWCLTSGERHATYGYGDGDNFLSSAHIIFGKAKHLLFVQNNKGDTPLHWAARAGKSKMVACLIELAEGDDRMKEFLRKENKDKETALHEAVRVGNKDIVDLLMEKDSELASFPEHGGASPMYLAIVLKWDEIVEKLYGKCSDDGNLSVSRPNGQNALHAAVLRYRGTHAYLSFFHSKLTNSVLVSK
jgi:ankyrin repeat protein